jgi:hypothetical protein
MFQPTTMFRLVQDGSGGAIDDTRRRHDPRPELSNAYRRLVGHIIVTIVLGALVIAEAYLFVSPAAPHTIPA